LQIAPGTFGLTPEDHGKRQPLQPSAEKSSQDAKNFDVSSTEENETAGKHGRTRTRVFGRRQPAITPSAFIPSYLRSSAFDSSLYSLW
jgi:hypothetical protein